MPQKQQNRRSHPKLNIRTKEHLALRLNYPVALLEDLARYRGVHYRNRTIPKKDGAAIRRISPPSPKLKSVQRRINDALLKPLWLPDLIHGYRQARSIVSAATPHQGSRFLLLVDIRNFFPSIGHQRVYGMYIQLGCSPDVAKLLTELTTHNRCLPQGAPTSPSLANLHIRLSGLAKRITCLARLHGLRVTIFGDDILISGSGSFRGLTKHIASIIRSCGLTINEDKTRVARPDERQNVLGIIANSRGSEIDVPRTYRKRLKAYLALCRRHGFAALRVPGKNAIAYLRGKIAFAVFVNRRNADLYEELGAILNRNRPVETVTNTPSSTLVPS